MDIAGIKNIFAKDSFIGIDIGSDSLKFVQIARKDHGLYIVRSELRDIKHGDSESASVEQMVPVLKDVLKGVALGKSYIAVGIDCSQTLVKPIVTPYMPRTELYEALRLDDRNYFPFSIDNSLLDFEILEEIHEKNSKQYEILAAVSPKTTVGKCLFILREAGIKPDVIVPSVYAYQKLVQVAGVKDDKPFCFVDLGKTHSELAIFKNGRLKFARKIPVTGNDFTEVLTSVMDPSGGRVELSWEKAEEIKRVAGIPSTSEMKVIDGKLSTMQILSALRTPLEHLINEIERCFDYYREETGDTVSSLTLFGGGAALAGLVRLLSSELSIDVRLGDSFRYFQLSPEVAEERSWMSYRVGTAIGAALTTESGINLLPEEFRKNITKTVKKASIGAVVGIIALVAVILYSTASIQLHSFQRRIVQARKDLSGMQSHRKKAEAFNLTNKLLVDEPHWEDIFKEISNLIPDDIYLTSMDMRDKTIIMTGIVTADDGEQDLSGFILNLRKGILKDAKLISTKMLDDRTGSRFEIKCNIG